jgi:hypothetical protein
LIDPTISLPPFSTLWMWIIGLEQQKKPKEQVHGFSNSKNVSPSLFEPAEQWEITIFNGLP